MKRLLTALLLAAVLAGLAGAALVPPDVVLGIEWRAGGGQLAWRSATTLKPAGPAIDVGGASVGLKAVSPDGTLAVLARSDGQLRIVQLRPLRSVWTLGLGEHVAAAVWAVPERIVALTGGDAPAVVVVDARARRVLSRQLLDGELWNTAAGGRRLLGILAPRRTIGPARLAIVEEDGSLRTIALPGVAAGFAPAPGSDGRGKHASPGLAVNAAGSRAAVAGLDMVLSVDLATLEIERVTTRFPARVGKRIEGWGRNAVWLRGDRVAVVGRTSTYEGDQSVSTTTGVQLYTLGSAAARVLDGTASGATRVGDTLLAFGGTALRGYRLDGTLRFELLRGSDTGYVQTAGRFAYVGSENSTRFTVVDVRAGKVVGTARTSKPTVVLR